MRAEAEAGTLVLPGGISISRSLVEALVRRPAARLLVTRLRRGSASFALTSATDGLVCAEPSAYTRVGTVWLPLLTCSTTIAGVGHLLDVDHVVGDALAVELAPAAGGSSHTTGWCTS